MEFEANSILLKHEIKSKTDQLEQLHRELNKSKEEVKSLQEQCSKEILEVIFDKILIEVYISNSIALFYRDRIFVLRWKSCKRITIHCKMLIAKKC